MTTLRAISESIMTPIPASAESTPIRTLAKIVATIGPASDGSEVVRRLIRAGVSVFRFNFSHGSFDDHARRLEVVRRVASEEGAPVAVLGDLQGPKIRVGKIPAGLGEASRSGGGTVVVEPGQDVVFKRGITEAFLRPIPGGMEAVLPVTYEALIDEVEGGHRVLINDGAIRLLAIERDRGAGELRCRVTTGGAITSGKGINLPHSELSAPSITERDWECVGFAVEHDFDYLALSFVRKAEEVMALREGVTSMCAATKRDGWTEHGAWIPIVAKIEKPQALEDLARIVDAADGIMVARGDLGVEMDIAAVPVAQKRIIAECGRQGKPCIVATQMLESMIESATPTRAEASDVANAIFDGADAVMLSAETATGKHPVLVVETMSRIIAAAEQRNAEQRADSTPPSTYTPEHKATAALAHGAWQVARDVGATLVACWSQRGGTARYLSQNNFNIPILAFTTDARQARRMALLGSVIPVVCDPAPSTLHDWTTHVETRLLAGGLARPGEWIVLLAGRPLGRAKATNTIVVHQVGQSNVRAT